MFATTNDSSTCGAFGAALVSAIRLLHQERNEIGNYENDTRERNAGRAALWGERPVLQLRTAADPAISAPSRGGFHGRRSSICNGHGRTHCVISARRSKPLSGS